MSEHPYPTSTFASRKAERLEREAREGMPERRKLALDVSDEADNAFSMATVDETGIS